MKTELKVWWVIFALVLAVGLALADEPQVAGLLGAGATNVTITSEVRTVPGWKRQVVTKIDDTILNDEGTVGDSAENAAAGELATGAQEIADAANASMTNALRVLDEAKGSAATNAVGFALAIAPEAVRSNLTAFVVKEETFDNGTKDRQWVWFSHDLGLEPNRHVVYSTYDLATTNKVTWTCWTNKVTVTENGRTWTGCRVCTVSRPTWAIGGTCLTHPNDRIGGPDGFDFGDIVLTSGGSPYLTTYVTNSVTGEVLYFDNGAVKGYWRNENE